MKPLPFLLALAALAGCAASRPGTNARPTLADLDRSFAGEAATVVLLDSSRVELRRVDRIGPDSLHGGLAERGRPRIALALADVAHLEVPADPYAPSGRRTGLGIAFLPVLCAVPFAAQALEGEDSYCYSSEEAGNTALCIVGASALGIGLVAAATSPPSREPVIIPISPLSQFEDAPREGVGVR